MDTSTPTRKPAISPRHWQPPVDQGLIGRFEANTRLDVLETLPIPGTGPEDVVVAADGSLFVGVKEGAILNVPAAGGPARIVADTGGRPLGIEIDKDGSLVVCDSPRGLMRIDPRTGAIETLVETIAGKEPLFVNNAAIAADGSIYFTDSTTTATEAHFKADLLEHGLTGRVFRLSPEGELDRIADGLAFANGVALSEDESVLMVAETGRYQVSRIELQGPNAGRREVVIDNLPGFPDNMSTGTNGTFWVAVPSLRNKLLDMLLPRPAWVRKAMWRLPEALQPDASRISFVIGIDAQGAVRYNLQADGSAFHYVTGVREHEGTLWLGSLMEPAVAKAKVSAVA